MQVLIIKMSSMGDVLHTLPALTDAAYALPGISFDWVVEEKFTEIPTWHPAVRRVISVSIRRWRKHWFSTATRQERCNVIHLLQNEHYDVIIDAQGLIKSAILLACIAHDEKHGLDYHSARESCSSWFYHRRHAVDKKQHAIERIRKLFSASLGYPLPTDTGDYAIDHYFSPSLSAEPPYLIFLHATAQSKKQWPECHWHELLQLADHAGYRIKLPWGTDHEHKRATRLIKGVAQAEVLPRLSLDKIAQQLIGATAVVSVDTGLSHLAAALNRPNLTLYGPTDPRLIGGYGPYQQVLRAQDRNMTSLSSQHVWQVFQQMLSLKIGNSSRESIFFP